MGFFAIASTGVILFALLQKFGPEASAAPGIYKTLNYQGKLEDVDGITVADGAHNIKFTIYDAAAAGNVLWTARESDACGAPFNPAAKSVTTSLGVFSTQLGESGDCPINLDFNTDSYYIGVTIGADSEMTPRKRIGASGYAFNADLLDGLNTSAAGGSSAFVPVTDSSGNFVLSANVTFDTNTFYLDSANDNIGIGTATPNIDRTLDLTTAKKYGLYTESSSGSKFAAGVYGATSSSANQNYGGSFVSAGAGGSAGVYGSTTDATVTGNYGGYFTTNGIGSVGVLAEATDASATFGVYGSSLGFGAITNYGGYFTAAGDTGQGVYGEAAITTGGPNYGGYFRARGTGSSAGVKGEALNAGAVANYGGYFTAAGDTGIAVYGTASATGAAVNYGAQFYAYGQNGRGVYGQAATTGAFINYGGVFEALGDLGVGVSGTASATGATTNYGGYFSSAGAGWEATGVYGVASGASTVRGVYGGALSTAAVINYGGFFQAQGESGRGIYAEANNAVAATNYGGYFTAAGTGFGTSGVHGAANASGAVTNFGGEFLAQGQSGRGVYGEANATGAVTNYGGYFTAAGDTGTAVFGSATAVAGASAIGGRFEAGGDGGAYGVQAASTAATGNNYGIYASVISATGWAGYFNGGKGIYADRFSINDAVSVVAYNTIGTAAASHTAAGEITDGSDLFIADDLEVNGFTWLDGGSADIAEMIAYSGEGEAGDVIVVDDKIDNSAKLSTKPYDQSVLGIIATEPSLIITGKIKEGKLLAIAGRVPTKVTNANGAIHRGDLLTTSSAPGRAMKATEPGPIVGKAMGECDQSECTIWVFINVSWYGGVRTETTAAEVSPVIEDAKNLERENLLTKLAELWQKIVSLLKK